MSKTKHVIAALALVSTLALSACGGDSSGTTAEPEEAASSTTTVTAEPTPTVFDPATATDEEKWSQYVRLLSAEGIHQDYWVAENARQAVKPSYMVTCERTLDMEVDVLGIMSSIYDLDELAESNRADVLFDQVYCPEKAAQAEQAWEQYQNRSKGKPLPADFTIGFKIREKQCFGSAGCNITYQIDPGYNGPSDLKGSWDVTYRVTGDESGPIINTFQLDNGSASYDQEEYASTRSSSTRLQGSVIRVDKQ